MIRPNFLWISLEDCSPRFGCYGDPIARTPHIDRLAREGVVFDHAFCTSPVCSPSRTALITGLPATAMGAQHMRTTYTAEDSPSLPTPYRAVPPPYVKCLTEQLRAEGYYCTNNGKTDYQFEAPFFSWDANGKPRTLGEIHWRHRPDPGQPFFAVFNLEDTHESRMWPGKRLALEPDLGEVDPTDPASVTVPPYLPDTPEVRVTLARHYDNIAHNDRLIGILLRQLEEDGLADRTVVMLWSDHGEGQPRAKRFLYDSGLRVPLIVRGPAFAGGRRDDRLVSLLDLAPTVYDCAGIPRPVHYSGSSLLDPAADAPRFIHAHRDRLDGDYDKSRCARSHRYKYIRNYFPGRERYGYIPYRSRHESMQAIRRELLRGDSSFDPVCPPEELFDLREDPHEIRNLAADPALRSVLRELREELDRWQARFDPDVAAPEEQLVERFWPGRRQPRTATPLAIVYHEDAIEGCPPEACGEVRGAALVQFYCTTEGASIGYRTGSAWRPYRRAIRLEAGVHRIEIQAERYGYQVSEPVGFTLEISPGK